MDVQFSAELCLRISNMYENFFLSLLLRINNNTYSRLNPQ